MGTSIITAGDCAEALLSGCVPNLQFNGFAVQLDGANFLQITGTLEKGKKRVGGKTHEIYADGGNVALCVGVIRETQQQA